MRDSTCGNYANDIFCDSSFTRIIIMLAEITSYTVYVTQFMQDAQEIMEVLVKVQSGQQEMEPDDPQVTPDTV